MRTKKLKLERLQREFDDHEEDYRAVSDQLACEQDPVSRNQLNRRLKQIENKMEQLEEEQIALQQAVTRPTIETIAAGLWSLNYDPQNDVFKKNTPASRRAAAFVVQAKDTRIQKWLVARLFNQIPNRVNAQVFTFLIPNHPLWKNRNFAEIWVDLGKKLNCAAEQRAVVDALAQIYLTKPVIIAMYGWMTTERSQDLQQQVLRELWEPLVRTVDALATKPRRSRLILFLAEASETLMERTADASASIAPIRLDPLNTISQADVENWFDSDPADKLLKQQEIAESRVTEFLQEEIPTFQGDPIQTLDQICYIFGLEHGIADIEAEWRLTG